MTERYGGKFSPDAASHPRKPGGLRRSRAGARVNFLFIAPVPMLLVAFQLEPTGMFLKMIAFGDMMLAAWLTQQGLIAEDAYEARRVAKKPAIPRKMFGSLLTGTGLAIAGLDPETFNLINPILYFILGTVLHFIAFGPDPMKDKGTEGMNEFQTDRVARVVDEAERHLAAMKDAIRRARVPALERRVGDFVETARGMFRVVEEDPRDLTSARRYPRRLSVGRPRCDGAVRRSLCPFEERRSPRRLRGAAERSGKLFRPEDRKAASGRQIIARC